MGARVAGRYPAVHTREKVSFANVVELEAANTPKPDNQ